MGDVNPSKKPLMILPEQHVRLGPLSNKILQTNTYYSYTLKVISIPSSSTIRNNS